MSYNIKPAAEQEVEQHIRRKVTNVDSSTGRGMLIQENARVHLAAAQKNRM